MDVAQLQHDINALFEWGKSWLFSFDISKCKHLHIGQQSHPHLDGTTIYSVVNMRDLGVIIDSDLKFHSHTYSATSKANRILSRISKSFINLSSDMLPILYKSLVRPLF